MAMDALKYSNAVGPFLKLRVFVDDITALVKVVNREVAEAAKKVMKKLKEEIEKKGLDMSVTENGKEGKSKMIASCGFLENELRECSKEGVTMADSVETLGVELRTRVNKLGAKGKARRKEVQSEILAHQEEQGLPKELHEGGVRKSPRSGMMPARTWGVHAVRTALTERFVFVHGSIWSGSRGGAFYLGHPVLGRRSLDGEMVPRTKRSVDEANSSR